MIEKLRELMRANPFRPFVIALADGRRFNISSPDLVWLPAPRGGLHIYKPGTDEIVSVNSLLIASVEWLSPDVAAGDVE